MAAQCRTHALVRGTAANGSAERLGMTRVPMSREETSLREVTPFSLSPGGMGEFLEVLRTCRYYAEQQSAGIAENRPLLVLLHDLCSSLGEP